VQLLKKIILRVYRLFLDGYFLLAVRLAKNTNSSLSREKNKILIVVDEVSVRSRRFHLISEHLKNRKWEISLLKTRENSIVNSSLYKDISSYRSNNEAIYKIFKNHNHKLIFLVSFSNLNLSLKALKLFKNNVVYDPIDIWPKNLNHEKASRTQLKISIKQEKVLLLSKNIVCRDLQLTSFDREMRKSKNIIFFPDYLDKDNLKIKKKDTNSSNKIKFVSIGNINTHDYLNGKAYSDFINLMKDNNCEFHFYLNQYHAGNVDLFYKENPFIDRKSKNIFLHDFISPDKITNKIKEFDYGIILLGDHFYKKYNQGIWKKDLFYKCGSARVSDYIFSNLDIVLAKTKPKNYLQFFAERYTNVFDFKENSLSKSPKKMEKSKKRNSLLISEQIHRLDFYLSNINKN
tara:strand:- start:1696 stop:2904 length:1209 start_codon:yes stop_codon:yes gene_type:complete